MLIQFRFKNFKSFRDDTVLDFSAAKITEHNSRVVQIGQEKVLPVAGIYGANASGKSNVIQAFDFMAEYVINSFGYGGEGADKQSKSSKLRHTPFLFDQHSKNELSLFEIFYTSPSEKGEKLYNYGFTMNQDGVVEEWLNAKAKTAQRFKKIFHRDKETIDLSGIPEKSQENIRIALEKETLIVSLGAKLKISKLKAVREWFGQISSINFGDPILNALWSTVIPEGFADDEEVQAKVVQYFSAFDPSIIGFNVERVKEDNDKIGSFNIEAIHKIIGTEQTISIPLKEESSGTLKMFTLYPMLQETLNNGGILFIDELNSRLHPLLVRNFLLSFLNPALNPNHAQLVFTTHDSWQLSNNLLRRDEIWFTEKNDEGVSSLFSLADFVSEDGTKIRKDESYEKNYLVGKYGAIPTLKEFSFVLEDSVWPKK